MYNFSRNLLRKLDKEENFSYNIYVFLDFINTKENVMRKFLNFCVPAILRIIAVIVVIGVSISIAPDPVAGAVGALVFWITYFVFQCRTMGWDFLFEKGIYVSSAVSVLGLFYGAFVFITGASESKSDPTIILSISLVVYPIITYLFCIVRGVIAGKCDDEDIEGKAIKYWLPVALVPIWSALIVKYFLINTQIAYILCGVILVLIFVNAVIARMKETSVSSAHADDKESHSDFLTEPYHARWENLTNRIAGDTYYVEGKIIVEYDDGKIRSFSTSEANGIAQRLIDRLKADVAKKHPECKHIDCSSVTIEYLSVNP